MFNFPIPENEELLYSVLARALVISGETDSKPFLKMVFGHSNVVASFDLPSNVEMLSKQYHESCNLPSIELIYKHTLFPIYAPFIEEKTRKKVIEWMKYRNSGAAQTATGRCASIVKAKAELMVCPQCLREQLVEKGVIFLKRSWMVPGIRHCLNHGNLYHTGIELGKDGRLAFKPLPIALAQKVIKTTFACEKLRAIGSAVDQLLLLPQANSPTFNQWSCYYKELGIQYGTTRGRQVDHSIIRERVITHWGANLLRELGLVDSSSDIPWLVNMFRKHRKSFSFLQHIIVLDALVSNWSWKVVISDVKRFPPSHIKKQSLEYQKIDLKRREEWEVAVRKYGIKGAMKRGYAGLRTWLYRHDTDWYKKHSQENSLPKSRPNYRVDWRQRDNQLCELLEKNLSKYNLKLIDRRVTKAWMMNLIDCKPMIENNQAKLPNLLRLFDNHAESISDYQIRRVNQTLAKLKLNDESIAEWKLLRFSKLSEHRIKPETSKHIAEILFQEGGEDTLKHCSR